MYDRKMALQIMKLQILRLCVAPIVAVSSEIVRVAAAAPRFPRPGSTRQSVLAIQLGDTSKLAIGRRNTRIAPVDRTARARDIQWDASWSGGGACVLMSRRGARAG